MNYNIINGWHCTCFNTINISIMLKIFVIRVSEMYQQEKSLSEVMILGVPVDNFTLDSAVQRILSYISDFKIDKRPRQVATVNVDFLMNSLSWSSSKTARHPELLDILRSADMVTADGMPIVWLSRLLKAPLKGRVTGADLVPALSEAIEKTGHSIFFLGGNGDHPDYKNF